MGDTVQANCCLLAAGVLGDGLGALRHGVLGQLTRQKQTDSGLDFSAGDGGPLVVVGQPGSLSSDSLEDVVDKAVHDRHSLAGHSGVWMHLFQYFVDVDGVGFPPPPLLLLVCGTLSLGLRDGLLGSFASCLLGWHDCSVNEYRTKWFAVYICET